MPRLSRRRVGDLIDSLARLCAQWGLKGASKGFFRLAMRVDPKRWEVMLRESW